MQAADTYGDYVSYEMEAGEKVISNGSILFCAPKHFRFVDLGLKVEQIGEKELLVTVSAYAKSVEIRNAEDALLLEDNYFDMNPGSRKIKVLKGEIKDRQIRCVMDIR